MNEIIWCKKEVKTAIAPNKSKKRTTKVKIEFPKSLRGIQHTWIYLQQQRRFATACGRFNKFS